MKIKRSDKKNIKSTKNDNNKLYIQSHKLIKTKL